MDRSTCRMQTNLLSYLQFSRLLSNSLAILTLLLFLQPPLSHAQCDTTIGCFPPLGNLALKRTIHTDSQCFEGESFCLPDTTDCSNVCSSNHSVDSINDGNNGTAWISSIGSARSNATLQLDFQEPVLFHEMAMLWKSVRPRAMVLERSSDRGNTWEAYRYYSSSCLGYFELPPTNTLPSVQFLTTEAICTESQSTRLIVPGTNDEVTFSTSEHLPPGTSTSDSTAYRQITNLRVRLLEQFDLGTSEDHQYYSVGEWLVMGSCMCNGHSSSCAPAPGESTATNKVYSGCMCEHNTMGTHCDSCETGFNSVPWAPGTPTEANTCERCECNGHAEDCTSENPEEGVVCIDCMHNTEGNHCDNCQAGFFENSSLLFTDPNVCIECGCDGAGISDSGACSETGQCSCKERVTGLQCSQCLEGYWNLTADNNLGCQECDCDARGTVLTTDDPALPLCDQTTGVCQCRENVGGNTCNICHDEYYSLDRGCLPCNCNTAASAGPVCDKESRDGQCPCLPNIDTPTCTTSFPGYYFRHLDHQLFEAEDAQLSVGFTQVYPGPESTTEYSGRGLVVFPASGTATFSVEVPHDYRYEIILRIQPSSAVDGVHIFIESQSPVQRDLHCVSVTSAITNTFSLPFSLTPTDHLVADSVCIMAGVTYTVTVEHLNAFDSPWMLDSLLILPDFSSESAYYAEVVAGGDTSLLEDCLPRSLASSGLREECRDIAFSLSVEFYGQVFECNCSGSPGANDAVVCDTYGGQCSCLEGVTGLQCDVCRNGWFNLTSSGCEVCSCDAEGSTSQVCNMTTGECDCQPNVQGLTCDSCTFGHHNLTATGCSDCNCSQFSTSVQCSDQGLCSCLPGVGGATCNRCLPGYYNISHDGCIPCDCSSVGVHSSSNDCDSTTGQCPCIGNTASRDCSQCPDDHYETSAPGTDVCLECVCSNQSDSCVDGSANYQAAALVSDFQQLCSEDPVNCDDGWQLLTVSGLSTNLFGPSDATGLGYIILTNGNPMLHAPSKFLGDQQSSYGLEFSVSISLSIITGLKDTIPIVLESKDQDPPRLIGVFPPPTSRQDTTSLNTLLTFTIPLMEDYWRVGSITGPPATFFQLYSILSNITQLSFSAEFRQDFIEFVNVQRVHLQTRVPYGTQPTPDLILLNTSFPAELCDCPPQYTGSSCQFCARGHARQSGNISDPCTECDCNNLSLDCDVDTAICTNCSGNSEGDHCQQCQLGYYGDPTRGIPCLPCQCPSSERSYSPTCFLDSDLSPTCDNCGVGYSGRSCELCADGFFGNPLIGQCITCECNGNVDPELGPVCDMDTGRCLNCLNNTIGFECQFCQPGFFGDPPSGLPCTPCQCHPNGTVGDCSSIFGTCTCFNENVLGEQCNECRDGYWGLSQGLPCIPCDCCSNGSNNHICDKDTGRCDCHENVGSEVDDKCCTCTPGYFDFTPSGCQECGCSALSVTEECDIVSGQCQCQEGAVGLKCDDCAFAFTGTVPDCTACHPCFLQWYQRIEEISEMVAVLQRRAEFLVEEYYNGYIVESIEADVEGLLQDLASINSSLQSITLDISTALTLQNILLEINEDLSEMDELTRDTEQQLVTAEQMLARTAAFDGTVNGITVDELVRQIADYNRTVAILFSTAQYLLNSLHRDQEEARGIWSNISALESDIQDLLSDSSLVENSTDAIEYLLNHLDQQRVGLRQNLTQLSEMAMSLTEELWRINGSVVNVSRDTAEASASTEGVKSQLAALRSQVDYVLDLTRQLNNSIETVREASQRLVELTSTIVDYLSAAWQVAHIVSDEIYDGLSLANELLTRLQGIKVEVENIFKVFLPSLDYIEDLARNISDSVVPESVVEEIAANASASHQTALQTLELAYNASEMVKAIQTLISQLSYDINSTEMAQERVQGIFSQLRGTIDSLRQQLQQVREGATEVNITSSQVQEMVEESERIIESATQLAQGLQNRSHELMYQASDNHRRSVVNEQVAEQLVSEAAQYQTETDTDHSESEELLENSTSLLSTAQQLSNTTRAVTVQQLQELLMEYKSERETVRDLRERIRTLRTELQSLTSIFSQTAQTLSQCYTTP